MEIRKLKPEENIQRELMASICFLDIEPEDRYAWLNSPLDHLDDLDYAWGAFSEDGTLFSSVIVKPEAMMFNGQSVKMAFTGGVTTLPEARNAGGVRKIYEKVFPKMKDDGILFSFVYPFSFPFYRKFGYEQSYSRSRFFIPIDALNIYSYPSGVRAHKKGDSPRDFIKVYNQFIKDKNLAIVRSDDEWQEILNRDPHLKREFTYIHYDNQGESNAYVLYTPVQKDDECLLVIKELVWSDISGLYDMLGFIYGLRSEYSHVSWEAPNCLDFFSLIEDSWEVSVKWEGAGMNRIVDLPRVLELLIPPSEYGSVILDVSDKFLPFNTGRYLLKWKSGSISVSKTDMLPDMETDIETLTQMVTGYLTPAQALYKKGISIHAKLDVFSALFPHKNLYMMELF